VQKKSRNDKTNYEEKYSEKILRNFVKMKWTHQVFKL
jgi:hypothetical protein